MHSSDAGCFYVQPQRYLLLFRTHNCDNVAVLLFLSCVRARRRNINRWVNAYVVLFMSAFRNNEVHNNNSTYPMRNDGTPWYVFFHGHSIGLISMVLHAFGLSTQFYRLMIDDEWFRTWCCRSNIDNQWYSWLNRRTRLRAEALHGEEMCEIFSPGRKCSLRTTSTLLSTTTRNLSLLWHESMNIGHGMFLHFVAFEYLSLSPLKRTSSVSVIRLLISIFTSTWIGSLRTWRWAVTYHRAKRDRSSRRVSARFDLTTVLFSCRHQRRPSGVWPIPRH